jgi:hypothetical protein
MLGFIHGGGFKLPYNICKAEAYRAPEILVHKKFNLDNPFAADLWSAGCAVRTIDLARLTFAYTLSRYSISLLVLCSLISPE